MYMIHDSEKKIYLQCVVALATHSILCLYSYIIYTYIGRKNARPTTSIFSSLQEEILDLALVFFQNIKLVVIFLYLEHIMY